LIVSQAAFVIKSGMVPDNLRIGCEFPRRIVLDDRRRLPWRFFGRFTASIAAGLIPASL
jgi:hypothetical protein